MLIDGHIHYDYPADPEKILRALKITNASCCSLESQITKKKLNQNFDELYAKLICGKKVYVDGAIDGYFYYHHELMAQIPNYIERMIACGIDGIKMIEGKPTERKLFPIPDFDDPLFEATFAYLEKVGLNITWHVNDPEEFWDDALVPDWARRSGWFYADGTYVNNIAQYEQVENVLKRHPNLKITFAHFYFLSNNLKELARLLDTYPNISVDITPGVEMFTNMSANISDARAFFKKYADRIIYGTDIAIEKEAINDLNEEDALTRKSLCHDFLTKEKFVLKGDANGLLGSSDLELNGLALDDEDVTLIECTNFLKRYPVNHDLNIPLILEEINIHQAHLKEMKLDDSHLKEIKKAFLKAQKIAKTTL